ncbi:hypothetical protein BDF14DRAFT_1826701 [Spinellus fusiger]|nr:hypothetical protein BDF14DRAFT_1826701 [Spinellus fusiger]
MGDWAAHNTRYHAPIHSVDLQKLLTKSGFDVFLINELKTSKCCPTCRDECLRVVKQIIDLRSYRRDQTPAVPCHGL